MKWMVVAFDGGTRVVFYERTRRAADRRRQEMIADDHWDDVVVLPATVDAWR
jgi:hypothetical protein